MADHRIELDKQTHDDDDSAEWTPPPRVDDLAVLFDAPPTRRPVELLPDSADYFYGDTSDMLVGLLHDAEDLRVGMFDIGFESDSPPPRPGYGPVCIHYQVPIVVARGRGAWVVCDALHDAPREAAEAIELRVMLVEALCDELGWQPEDVPLGVTLVSTTRDFGPGDTGELPVHECVGRRDLPRLAQRLASLPVGPPERQGRLTPELTARFFADLPKCGDWVGDVLDDTAIEIPTWMVRRDR